ncbi:MAG: Metallo-beta-lactamase domain protein [Promethearchaeota archaeon]|nr:MAG: Metallo-beta-lactamase domain protein [Candidatus Lokiarchaeota archaeon]
MIHQPIRKRFKLPKQRKTTWNEIFNNPKDILIDTFETGTILFSNKYMLNLSHPYAKELNEEELQVPVFSHLITHKTYGHFLIDSGLDRSFQNDVYGNIEGKNKEILWPLKSYQEPNQDIASLLLDMNINLKGIFLTHLHIDHVAGIQDLPKDIQVIIGKDEPFHFFGKNLYQDHFKGRESIHEIDFSQAHQIPPLESCINLFGDGSLWALFTPGHTKSHVSYLVNGKKQVMLLTGDACDIKLGFERCVGPGLGCFNVKGAQETLEKIKHFSDQFPNIKLCFGHEKID